MLIALEGLAGAGKSTVRDRLLSEARSSEIPAVDLGQFSWLDPAATRTLVALRSGRRRPGALACARRDLALHLDFNLRPARLIGQVIADRWLISTACLLALVNRRSVGYYVKQLAADEDVHPDITVLLTTPPHVCLARLWKRESPRRFGEEPGHATRLALLYEDAAEAWTRVTGKTVLRHVCRTSDDLDRITSQCLTLLGGVPAGG